MLLLYSLVSFLWLPSLHCAGCVCVSSSLSTVASAFSQSAARRGDAEATVPCSQSKASNEDIEEMEERKMLLMSVLAGNSMCAHPPLLSFSFSSFLCSSPQPIDRAALIIKRRERSTVLSPSSLISSHLTVMRLLAVISLCLLLSLSFLSLVTASSPSSSPSSPPLLKKPALLTELDLDVHSLEPEYADDGAAVGLVEEGSEVREKEGKEGERRKKRGEKKGQGKWRTEESKFSLLNCCSPVFVRCLCLSLLFLPPPSFAQTFVSIPRLRPSQFRDYMHDVVSSASSQRISSFVETNSRMDAAARIVKCKVSLNSWLHKCVF